MKMIKDWFNVLLLKTKPADIVREAELKKGIIEWIKASIIVGIIMLIVSVINPEYYFSPYTIIQDIIASLIGLLTIGGVFHVFSLALGGKGKFSKLIGSMAQYYAALLGSASLIIAIFLLIGSISYGLMLIFSAFNFIIALILFFIILYSFVVITKEVEQLTLNRAIIVVILTIFVIWVLSNLIY